MDKNNFIRIKYTDSFEKIQVRLRKFNFDCIFKRNEWKAVPRKIARILQKRPNFITEDDVIFHPELLKESNLKIGLKRFGAYGDLIQLIPVVKYLKRTTNNKFYLLTNNQYIKDFKSFNVFDDVFQQNINRKLFDKVIYLDGVLEKDHSLTNHQRAMHRIKIFEEFFYIHIDKYDFSVNISDKDKKFIKEVLKR
jgi:hypothetical protein